ncbi:YafY family protein [Streptomyces sp. PmtG]
MRASRLLAALMLLQARGRVTAEELAGALGVSVRTVYRDMDALGAAGVPVYGEAGQGGGYRLVDGFRTRLTGLTGGEADALFLTGLPGAAADLGLGPVLAAARLKLMAALPEELRDRAERVSERFHLDAPRWYGDAEPTPHLTALADAVWHARVIRIHYLRWTEPRQIERSLQPLGLVLKAGHWYLVARREDAEPRTYRVSRVLALDVLPETFPRPDGFDLVTHWRTYLAEFDARRHQREAVLRLSPTGMRRLPDLLEPALVRAAHATAGPPDEHGWVRVTVPVESAKQSLPHLLKLGADAEILAPDDLRARVTEIARALGGLYGV